MGTDGDSERNQGWWLQERLGYISTGLTVPPPVGHGQRHLMSHLTTVLGYVQWVTITIVKRVVPLPVVDDLDCSNRGFDSIIHLYYTHHWLCDYNTSSASSIIKDTITRILIFKRFFFHYGNPMGWWSPLAYQDIHPHNNPQFQYSKVSWFLRSQPTSCHPLDLNSLIGSTCPSAAPCS